MGTTSFPCGFTTHIRFCCRLDDLTKGREGGTWNRRRCFEVARPGKPVYRSTGVCPAGIVRPHPILFCYTTVGGFGSLFFVGAQA